MPVSIQVITTYISDKLTDTPILKKVTKNPIYTALLITFIIVIIVIVIFRDVDTGDESLSKLAVRTGIYSFIFVVFVQFLQNHNIMTELKKGAGSEYIDDVFNTTGDVGLTPRRGGEKPPVGLLASQSVSPPVSPLASSPTIALVDVPAESPLPQPIDVSFL
jgi:hypothetical protein